MDPSMIRILCGVVPSVQHWQSSSGYEGAEVLEIFEEDLAEPEEELLIIRTPNEPFVALVLGLGTVWESDVGVASADTG